MEDGLNKKHFVDLQSVHIYRWSHKLKIDASTTDLNKRYILFFRPKNTFKMKFDTAFPSLDYYRVLPSRP